MSGNPVVLTDPSGLLWVQVAGTLLGAGFGIYNGMQNPCNDLQDILISAGIGAATGFAGSFGAGPLGAAAFGAGASMAGEITQQLINHQSIVDIQSVITVGIVGGITGGIANSVGTAIAPSVVKEYGVLASAAQVRPGQAPRMLPRPNIYGPDQNIVDGVGVGLGAQVSAAQAANSSTSQDGRSAKCDCN